MKSSNLRKIALLVLVAIIFLGIGFTWYWYMHINYQSNINVGNNNYVSESASSSSSSSLMELKPDEDRDEVIETEDKYDNIKDSNIIGSDALTYKEAEKIAESVIIDKYPGVKVVYDHDDNRNGKNYYVIQVYEPMLDHISTVGWYYVEVDTGKAYEWDLITDKLIPIN